MKIREEAAMENHFAAWKFSVLQVWKITDNTFTQIIIFLTILPSLSLFFYKLFMTISNKYNVCQSIIEKKKE